MRRKKISMTPNTPCIMINGKMITQDIIEDSIIGSKYEICNIGSRMCKMYRTKYGAIFKEFTDTDFLGIGLHKTKYGYTRY